MKLLQVWLEEEVFNAVKEAKGNQTWREFFENFDMGKLRGQNILKELEILKKKKEIMEEEAKQWMELQKN